jgi:hypothetical protein
LLDGPDDPSAVQRIGEIDSFGCHDGDQWSKILIRTLERDPASHRKRIESALANIPTCRLWNRGEQVKIIERQKDGALLRCLAPYPDGGPCFWTDAILERARETGNPHP